MFLHPSVYLFVSKMSKKNGLAEAGGQTVLGPKISGLVFSDDPDLGFTPLGTIMISFY